MKNFRILFLLLIIGIVVVSGVISSNRERDVKKERVQREVALMKDAKKDFEAELRNVVPAQVSSEVAPYGLKFYQAHTEGILTGYHLSKAFRVHNTTKEILSQQIDSHLETIGYSIDTQRGGWSSANGFNVHTKLIPFDEKDFVDVEFELERNIPFDVNRKYIPDIEKYIF